jgi:hypothetical protein
MKRRRFDRRHGTLAAAALVSAAVHAVLVMEVPGFGAPAQEAARPPEYVAMLVPPPLDPDDLPRPRPPAPKKPAPHPAPRVAHHAAHGVASPPAPVVSQVGEPMFLPVPMEPLAQAQPLPALESVSPLPLPPRDLASIDPQTFPVDAIPDDLEIKYTLTSAIADAHAVYRWQRDGDHYRITGEGAADGFFSLFLDGRMLQESEGTVTRDGLKPARFVEKKPNTQDEGLEFDWRDHRVTYEWGDNHRKEDKLADDSVDWLSMIFQLAHVPPAQGARDMKISVLTQRKQYHFDLQVVGAEDIVIPLGHVRALHLRHVDTENPKEIVDVWLGVDQHYLPVKLRYPVAHNRLVVEQSATVVSSR